MWCESWMLLETFFPVEKGLLARRPRPWRMLCGTKVKAHSHQYLGNCVRMIFITGCDQKASSISDGAGARIREMDNCDTYLRRYVCGIRISDVYTRMRCFRASRSYHVEGDNNR
jgi:hypothetical protein